MNFSKINKAFLNLYGLTPYQINNGNCYHWCLVAYRLTNNRAKLITDSNINHAFILFNNKYYDAESPRGILHWENLKIYKEIGIPFSKEIQSYRDFLNTWHREGASGLQLNLVKKIYNNCAI